MDTKIRTTQPLTVPSITSNNIWLRTLIINGEDPSRPVKLSALLVPINDDDGSLIYSLSKKVLIVDLYNESSGSSTLATAVQSIMDALTEQISDKGLFPASVVTSSII